MVRRAFAVEKLHCTSFFLFSALSAFREHPECRFLWNPGFGSIPNAVFCGIRASGTSRMLFQAKSFFRENPDCRFWHIEVSGASRFNYQPFPFGKNREETKEEFT